MPASIVKHVDHAVGSVHCSMSDSQLTEKFMDQCVPVLGLERTQKASEWCWALDSPILMPLETINTISFSLFFSSSFFFLVKFFFLF